MSHTETIPWERSKDRSGYTSLDMTLTLGGQIGTIEVRRNRPNEPNPGAFVGWHNMNRISDRHYTNRAEALAEAESYLYSLPLFKASNTAVTVMAMVERGREAWRDGKSIYDNPVKADNPIERAHWAAGWIEAHTATIVGKALGETLNANEGVIATARANAILDADNRTLSIQNRLHSLALEFATTKLEYGDSLEQHRFLCAIRDSDADTLDVDFPEWMKFVQEKEPSWIIERPN